ncbi:kelch-like protein 34 [Clarias gariepinus]|uniref:kelch-like protein 34 n=1 Tax=Clarias gariepinus TaxID=13013 RepID=UPI00234DC97E|nr:kelch-like protein 34 [Clarias gariepinus]
MSYFLMLSKSHGEGLLSRYQRLRQDGQMCDIILKAEGKEFPAHRTLLACSSDYFWSLFQEHTLESKARTVFLPAVSATGLELVLDFIYTSWISLSPSTLEDTLEASCYLQVTHALDLCTEYISNSLTLDNCCFFANVAARYSLFEACAVTSHFIARNLAGLLGDRSGLLDLNFDSFREVLGSDEIPGVKETALLQLALDWLSCNSLPALESNSLLSRIRFGLVPPKDLTHLSSLNPTLRTPFIHSLVQKALHYHMQVPLQPLIQSIHTSLRGTTNTVLLVGGGSESDRPQTQIQSFNQESKKFQVLPINMVKKLQHQGVCVVGNFLFVLGGEVVEVDEENVKTAVMTVSDQVCRYDPRFERWEEMEPLLQKRAQFSCCVVEGVIYAIGGRGQKGEPTLASVEKYNMNAGCWRSSVALPHALHGQACATIGRGIYISGGIHGSHSESSKEVLFLNTFDKDVWVRRSPMSIARFGHQMAAINEKLYAFLGMYEPFCDIECYDPKQNQWTRLKPLLQDRFCYGLTVTPGGCMLMFGGRKWRDGQEVCVCDVLEYNPEYDCWKKVCKLPHPLCGAQCAQMSLQECTES